MFTPAGVMPNEMFLQPPEFSPVKWLEGTKADNSAPNYLVSSQRRRGQLDNIDISTISVKIGDLGGGNEFIILPKSKIERGSYISSYVGSTMRPMAGDTNSLAFP